jgi:hypothetical protein
VPSKQKSLFVDGTSERWNSKPGIASLIATGGLPTRQSSRLLAAACPAGVPAWLPPAPLRNGC